MKTAHLVCVLGLLTPTLAQAKGMELTAYGGYNLGSSIDFRENAAYQLHSSDSFATGLSLTWQRSPSHAFELFWGYRPADIQGDNPTQQEETITSLDAHDFHGNFLFMPAYRETNFTPFLLLGLGATYLNPGDVVIPGGQTVSPDGATKFSWAIGAGAKTLMSERFGLRGQVRFHSTYIADEEGGTWCDPWYGCYETVDTNWLDEWDFTGGLIILLGS